MILYNKLFFKEIQFIQKKKKFFKKKKLKKINILKKILGFLSFKYYLYFL